MGIEGCEGLRGRRNVVVPGWGPCFNSRGVAYAINFLFPQLATIVKGEDEAENLHAQNLGCLANPNRAVMALCSRQMAFCTDAKEAF